MIQELLATILTLPVGNLLDHGANTEENGAEGWRARLGLADTWSPWMQL